MWNPEKCHFLTLPPNWTEFTQTHTTVIIQGALNPYKLGPRAEKDRSVVLPADAIFLHIVHVLCQEVLQRVWPHVVLDHLDTRKRNPASFVIARHECLIKNLFFLDSLLFFFLFFFFTFLTHLPRPHKAEKHPDVQTKATACARQQLSFWGNDILLAVNLQCFFFFFLLLVCNKSGRKLQLPQRCRQRKAASCLWTSWRMFGEIHVASSCFVRSANSAPSLSSPSLPSSSTWSMWTQDPLQFHPIHFLIRTIAEGLTPFNLYARETWKLAILQIVMPPHSMKIIQFGLTLGQTWSRAVADLAWSCRLHTWCGQVEFLDDDVVLEEGVFTEGQFDPVAWLDVIKLFNLHFGQALQNFLLFVAQNFTDL